MSEVKVGIFLPPRFAGDISAARALLRGIARREAAKGRFTLPSEWHIAEVRADLVTSRYSEGKVVRAEGVVREGSPNAVDSPGVAGDVTEESKRDQ